MIFLVCFGLFVALGHADYVTFGKKVLSIITYKLTYKKGAYKAYKLYTLNDTLGLFKKLGSIAGSTASGIFGIFNK